MTCSALLSWSVIELTTSVQFLNEVSGFPPSYPTTTHKILAECFPSFLLIFNKPFNNIYHVPRALVRTGGKVVTKHLVLLKLTFR